MCEYRGELGRLFGRDASAQLRVGERAFQLGEQGLRDDELELPGGPASDDLPRRSAAREQGGYEDVRVEDGAHSAPAAPRRVLGLDSECERLFLAEVVA